MKAILLSFITGLAVGVVGMALVARHNLKRILSTLGRLNALPK